MAGHVSRSRVSRGASTAGVIASAAPVTSPAAPGTATVGGRGTRGAGGVLSVLDASTFVLTPPPACAALASSPTKGVRMGHKSMIVRKGGGRSRSSTWGGDSRYLLGWATAAPGARTSPSGGVEDGHAPPRPKGHGRLSSRTPDQVCSEQIRTPESGVDQPCGIMADLCVTKDEPAAGDMSRAKLIQSPA